MLTVSGMHFHAVKSLKNNRRKIHRKKEEAFDYIGKNKFINASSSHIDMSPELYESLKQIKKERELKAVNIRRFAVLAVFALVSLATLFFLYFT